MDNQISILRETLSPARIRLRQDASSKKKALEICAEILADSDAALDQDSVMEALSAREKLGSTALEHGVALPHCRVSACVKPMCALVTLSEGVDFEARDNLNSNILCALIVPEDSTAEHLEILATIAALLSNPVNRKDILDATDNNALYLKITDSNYLTSAGEE
ncbi:MAG: PTS sugar transporter subunit IIA [Pseudomonadales bacterium]